MMYLLPLWSVFALLPLSDGSLNGVVVDAASGKPVQQASVTLIEMNRTTETDAKGLFQFNNLPKGRHTLCLHASLYASIHTVIEVPLKQPLTIQLQYHTHFDEEITVTAAPWAIKPLDTPQTLSIISAEQLSASATSLGEGLAHVPGVDQIGTGDSLGTPVIRGVSENRIKVMHDGIGQNHQQFSFRHSPNIETAFAHKIEIVKGPHSVLHGPDAMGGVINVISALMPTAFDSDPTLEGSVVLGHETNADRNTAQASLQGAVEGFGWRVGALNRQSGDMETPEEILENTDFEQSNYELNLGYSGEWGTLKAKATHWEDKTGFYRPVDFRLNLDNDFYSVEGLHFIKAHQLSWMAGRQENRRAAYPAALNGKPAVDLELNTNTGRLKWRLPARKGGNYQLNATFVLEYTDAENTPHAKKKLLPAYTSDNLSFVSFQELAWGSGQAGKHVISLGMRFDTQDLKVPATAYNTLSRDFQENYEAFTGSLGYVRKINQKASLALNLSRGWRPPNTFELFANGIHGGVSAVQIGNRDLEEESNTSYEVSLRTMTDHFSGSVTVYHTDYDQYIALFDSGEMQAGLPVFHYRQEDAIIRGIELEMDWFPFEILRVGGNYTAIQSENLETKNSLPQTPANKGSLQLEWMWRSLGKLHDVHAGMTSELVGGAAISGSDEPFGTSTDAYQLLNLSAGGSLAMGAAKSQTLQINFMIENALDETYKDFLYPYKAWADNAGRNFILKLNYRF
ncbi:MAG: hypothetical protein CR997_05995 [Acidobacteria bacterium]|nr:MAG: hypothetical protein CR997_05995 [Acidobacteriota bacterium]